LQRPERLLQRAYLFRERNLRHVEKIIQSAGFPNIDCLYRATIKEPFMRTKNTMSLLILSSLCACGPEAAPVIASATLSTTSLAADSGGNYSDSVTVDVVDARGNDAMVSFEIEMKYPDGSIAVIGQTVAERGSGSPGAKGHLLYAFPFTIVKGVVGAGTYPLTVRASVDNLSTSDFKFGPLTLQ
jgi:hypothetical protein